MSMPAPLLSAHAAQMRHLEAEEALQLAERVAVGSGTLRRWTAQRIVRDWQRAVDRPRAVLRPRTREAYDAQMAVSGIAVKRVAKADG